MSRPQTKPGTTDDRRLASRELQFAGLRTRSAPQRVSLPRALRRTAGEPRGHHTSPWRQATQLKCQPGQPATSTLSPRARELLPSLTAQLLICFASLGKQRYDPFQLRSWKIGNRLVDPAVESSRLQPQQKVLPPIACLPLPQRICAGAATRGLRCINKLPVDAADNVCYFAQNPVRLIRNPPDFSRSPGS